MPTRPSVYRLVAVAALALTACRSSGGASGGAPAAPAASVAPAEVTARNVQLGDSLFNGGGCARCHGRAGIGGNNGPALNDAAWVQIPGGAYESIVQVITNGVPATAIKDSTRKFPMRPRGGPMNLNDDQVKAVAAYVWSLSHK